MADRAIAKDVADGMAVVLRALAEPFRLQIVSALATAPNGSVAAGDLAAITDLTGPTVSHHLKSLREAGVVVSQRRGTWVFYALAPGMDRVASGLLDALSAAAMRSAYAGMEEAGATMGHHDEHELLNTDAVLDRVSEGLIRRFPAMDPELVLRVLRDSYADLARTARITQHLPILAQRFAAQRLEDIERVEVPAAAGKPQVLFVCVANAGRSQLAAALLRKYAGEGVVVRSAGSMPAAEVHATVAPLLDELLADQPADADPYPKPLTDDAVRAADVVITMGCGDTCPVFPGKRYEDWAVGDPALASPAGVRAIYDDLEVRVRDLATQLMTAPAGAGSKENA